MKWILFGIVIVALVNSASGLMYQETQENTIYVDDDNVDGPWDGTLEHPFLFIQDAVDVAEYGDTVFVFNGYYQDQYVIIDESIDLIGEGKEDTIILNTAGYWILQLNADNIYVEGFWFQHASNAMGTKKILVNGNHCTITNCMFRDESNIIYNIDTVRVQGDYTSITDNIFDLLKWNAIKIIDSNDNVITGNYIKWKFWGIALMNSDRNSITDNDIEAGSGIYLDNNSDQNIIENNDLYCSYPITIDSSSSNRILDNRIDYGIRGIILTDADNNDIIGNDFIRCGSWKDKPRDVEFTDSDNNFDGNYWNRERIFPKLILGINNGRLAFEIDWHPAKTPYEI